MNSHHTLNPFVSVTNGRNLINSCVSVLGGTETEIVMQGDRIAHAEVQVGDATIGITEILPHANYVWLITADIDALKARIDTPGSGWKFLPTDPKSPILHALDPAGIAWIIQPAPPAACPRGGAEAESTGRSRAHHSSSKAAQADLMPTSGAVRM